ncbi:serine/threonine protein kinase [Saccharomycopsis crataegensis]|uniref:non-specific serine/threonine protein kinase n=1 Tax=Saccharomycopsis crataegensis TaxID=43959 RepID=A0AAV5QKP0_9ASCO|nr:serine/threonine protein kinase [Saccharomycopsis crataegensis]
MGSPPPNAYPPGTVLTVGSHKAMIVKYISEGGFAHVYIVKISPYENGQEIACLKRVLVPNKATLNILRAEVDAMKRLQGKPCIVSYIDSHAARSPSNDGTYEVFLLMEYCSKNGLIDFLNSRLQNRLTEPEILQIMYEVTIGLSQVHFLNPPLIHRDIKIENILINDRNEYRLCDFGSSCPPLRPPRNQQELKILQNDILRYTTAQYRAPEMIDLTRGLPINEKSDIWALGVFCYKICYYTTPFEQTGEAAILQSSFTFPSYPVYSGRLQNLIRVLLTNDARLRPNVYQVLEEVCKMKSVPIPLEIQQQYLTFKQQMAAQQMLQQQKQQAAAIAASNVAPQQPSTIPSHVSGQVSAASTNLYNDNLAKSNTSIKSTKSGKSLQSTQSGKSLQSAASSISAKSNNVIPSTASAITQLTSTSTTTFNEHPSNHNEQFKNKSSPALNKLSASSSPEDPFADLIKKGSMSSISATTTQPKPLIDIVKDKVDSAKPKVRRKPYIGSPPDLSLKVMDIDGLRNKFEDKSTSTASVAKPSKPINSFKSKGSSVANGIGSTDSTTMNEKSSGDAITTTMPDGLRKTLPPSDVGKSANNSHELRRSHSFHKRTISAGKTSLNKLTNSLTGKFRASSNNSRLSRSNTGKLSVNNTGRQLSSEFNTLTLSSTRKTTSTGSSSDSSKDIDESEDELISQISMKEFKNADYLQKKPSTSTSVQKRMEMLLNNKDEIVKTATGYGKYTGDDQNTKVEISQKAGKFLKPITNKRKSLDLIRHKTPSTWSSSGTRTTKESSLGNSKLFKHKSADKTPTGMIPPTTPSSAASSKPAPVTKEKKKIPPPRPKKPSHLVSPKVKSKEWSDQTSPIAPKSKPNTISRLRKDDDDDDLTSEVVKENAFFEDDGIIDGDFDENDFEKSFNEKYPKLM